MANQALRVGELRPNQLLHTYGVGAVADLPNLSVVVAGLDDWELGNSLIVTERRLLSAVQAQLGPQVETLRTPPYKPETPDPFGDWARIGVPVRLFPRWLRCSDTRCNRLAPVESRLFDLLTDPWRPERIRYVHSCRGHGYSRPTAVPARFVLACARGHLDDFPWLYYVHGGQEPGGGEHTLRLSERGTTGEAANLFVDCSCGKSRPMAQALGRESWKHLPGCRGRHPHLGSFDRMRRRDPHPGPGRHEQLVRDAGARVQPATGRGRSGSAGRRELAATEPARSAAGASQAKALLPSLACWPDVEPYGADAVWQAIRRRAEDEEDERRRGRLGHRPEGPGVAGVHQARADRAARLHHPEGTAATEGQRPGCRRSVLVPRLREVSALYGFTRIDSPEWDILSTDRDRIVPIARDAPSWVPVRADPR